MMFSVIIPTYNRAALVVRTLETVLAQTDRDFEVIVVDDGSTDDTEARVRAIGHPQLTYYRKPNAERGAARNFGAAKSSGRYLTFFDSDDRMDARHLSEARRCIEELKEPAVFSVGFRVEDAQGRVLHEIRDLPDPMNRVLLESNILGCNPVFVRRDVALEIPFGEQRELAGSEDWLLWLKLAARHEFRFWNQVTCALVEHEGRSVYHFEESKLEARSRLMLDGLRQDPPFMRRYGGHLRRIRAFRLLYTGLHLALSGGVGRPLLYLSRAALADPRSLLKRTSLGLVKHSGRSLARRIAAVFWH